MDTYKAAQMLEKLKAFQDLLNNSLVEDSEGEDEYETLLNACEKNIVLDVDSGKEILTKAIVALIREDNSLSENDIVVAENNKEFEQKLDNVKNVKEKPKTFIVRKANNQWIFICVVQFPHAEVFYKDPGSDSVYIPIKEILNEKLSRPQIIINTVDTINDFDNDAVLGNLTILNLKKFLPNLADTKKLNKNTFQNFRFSTRNDITTLKNKAIDKHLSELTEKEDFIKALEDFIDNIPNNVAKDIQNFLEESEKKLTTLDLVEQVLEEKKLNKVSATANKKSEKKKTEKENTKKDKTKEEEPVKEETEIDKLRKLNVPQLKSLKNQTENDLTDLRKKQKNSNNVKVLNDKFKPEEKLNKNATVFEMEIEKTFRSEMRILEHCFKILETFQTDKEDLDTFTALKKKIANALGISEEKFTMLYEYEHEHQTDATVDKMESLKNVTEEKQGKLDSGSLTKEDVFASDEFILGADLKGNSDSDKETLKKQFDRVLYYREQLKTKNFSAIQNWSEEKKTKKIKTDEDIFEAIAYCDRAVVVLKGWYGLRNPALLAILIFFYNNKDKGRLCQIKTGEGKTLIVACLAVIRVLQGHTVDIITSNPVLALEGKNETKKFFDLFKISVSTNNIDDELRNYKTDVLYGSISNFQFDYLKDSFEGMNVRKKRKFDQLILDEVDSMLIDNGGNIAKLAGPFPGMDCLKYVYINIWLELNKTLLEEKEKADNFGNSINETEIEKIMKSSSKEEIEIIKKKVRDAKPGEIHFIPKHLKKFVQKKMNIWIDSAIQALYYTHENQQYRLIKKPIEDGRLKTFVVPIDNVNTGVTLNNTIWANGLHQFVELKHKLGLTFESMTSSFISNLGYIKLYKDKMIFGMTGTLGSTSEQNLLCKSYNLDFAKLPTYTKKIFEELPGIVCEDDRWASTVVTEIMVQTEKKRGVLAIFQTIGDITLILRILKEVDEFSKLRLYRNEEDAHETQSKVIPGEVILATNLAGRGTNFKTTDDVEANGGLHVLVCFLPCNKRVEDQAFGRTSRQGKKGTAQLILRQSELKRIGIYERTQNIFYIKTFRDIYENERLENIQKTLLKELQFKDELFKLFTSLYRDLKKGSRPNRSLVLLDLKEFWAYWLEMNDFTSEGIDKLFEKLKSKSGENITMKDVVQETYKEFYQLAKNTITYGEINHNPYYCLSLADYYIQRDLFDEAKKALDKGLQLSGETSYLMAGAYCKQFEITVVTAKPTMKKLKKALAKCFFINTESDDRYIHDAKALLEKAQTAVQQEMKHIQDNMLNSEDTTVTTVFIVDIANNNKPSSFYHHMNAKYQTLNFSLSFIENLIEHTTKNDNVDFESKSELDLSYMSKILKEGKMTEEQINQLFMVQELFEVKSTGLNICYTLKDIPDVPGYVIHTAQAEILGGIVALAIGLAWFPSFNIMRQISSFLISEGILDIVFSILSHEQSSVQDFATQKFYSLAGALVSFGVSAIASSVKILKKAVSFCRKLADLLKKSKFLPELCEKLAVHLEKAAEFMVKRIQTITSSLNHMSRGRALIQFATSLAKNLASTIAQQVLIDPLKKQLMESFKSLIINFLRKKVEEQIKSTKGLIDKIKKCPTEKVKEIADDFLKTDESLFDTCVQIIEKEFFKQLNNMRGTGPKLVAACKLVKDVTKHLYEFISYFTKYATYLNSKLSGNYSENNDTKNVIKQLAIAAAERAYNLLQKLLDDTRRGIKMGRQFYQDFKNNKIDFKLQLEPREFFNAGKEFVLKEISKKAKEAKQFLEKEARKKVNEVYQKAVHEFKTEVNKFLPKELKTFIKDINKFIGKIDGINLNILISFDPKKALNAITDGINVSNIVNVVTKDNVLKIFKNHDLGLKNEDIIKGIEYATKNFDIGEIKDINKTEAFKTAFRQGFKFAVKGIKDSFPFDDVANEIAKNISAITPNDLKPYITENDIADGINKIGNSVIVKGIVDNLNPDDMGKIIKQMIDNVRISNIREMVTSDKVKNTFKSVIKNVKDIDKAIMDATFNISVRDIKDAAKRGSVIERINKNLSEKLKISVNKKNVEKFVVIVAEHINNLNSIQMKKYIRENNFVKEVEAHKSNNIIGRSLLGDSNDDNTESVETDDPEIAEAIDADIREENFISEMMDSDSELSDVMDDLEDFNGQEEDGNKVSPDERKSLMIDFTVTEDALEYLEFLTKSLEEKQTRNVLIDFSVTEDALEYLEFLTESLKREQPKSVLIDFTETEDALEYLEFHTKSLEANQTKIFHKDFLEPLKESRLKIQEDMEIHNNLEHGDLKEEK